MNILAGLSNDYVKHLSMRKYTSAFSQRDGAGGDFTYFTNYIPDHTSLWCKINPKAPGLSSAERKWTLDEVGVSHDWSDLSTKNIQRWWSQQKSEVDGEQAAARRDKMGHFRNTAFMQQFRRFQMTKNRRCQRNVLESISSFLFCCHYLSLPFAGRTYGSHRLGHPLGKWKLACAKIVSKLTRRQLDQLEIGSVQVHLWARSLPAAFFFLTMSVCSNLFFTSFTDLTL